MSAASPPLAKRRQDDHWHWRANFGSGRMRGMQAARKCKTPAAAAIRGCKSEPDGGRSLRRSVSEAGQNSHDATAHASAVAEAASSFRFSTTGFITVSTILWFKQGYIVGFLCIARAGFGCGPEPRHRGIDGKLWVIRRLSDPAPGSRSETCRSRRQSGCRCARLIRTGSSMRCSSTIRTANRISRPVNAN